MRGNFEDLLQFLRVQDTLKTQGYVPIGWACGFLVWSREGSGNVCTVRDDVRPEDVVPIDSVNALLSR